MGKRLIVKILTSALSLPLLAAAQGTIPGGGAGSRVTNICKVFELVAAAASWLGLFVFILAIIIILYSAFLFLTAGGNEETLKKAKQVLIWGLIAIAIGLFALSAIPFIISIVGGTAFSQCVQGI